MKRFEFLVFLGLVLAGYILFNPEEVFAIRWVKPTGFNDPSNAWTYESRAYDNSTSTYAYTSSNYTNAWTPFLELTSSPIPCEKIRFYQGLASYYTSIDIDVFNNASQQWQDVYEGSFTAGSWIEKNIPGGTIGITKARIRLNVGATSYKGRIYEFEFWDACKPPYWEEVDIGTPLSTFDSGYAMYRDKIILSWSPAVGAAGYKLYSYESGGSNLVATVVGEPTYTLTSLVCGKNSWATGWINEGYYIKAYDSCGESEDTFYTNALGTLYCYDDPHLTNKALFMTYFLGETTDFLQVGDYIFQAQWNMNSWQVRKIRISDGKVVGYFLNHLTQPNYGSIWTAFAYDGSYLWLAPSQGRLVKMNPDTGEIVIEPDLPGEPNQLLIYDLEYDGNGYIWAAFDDWYGSEGEGLLKIDKNNGQVVGKYYYQGEKYLPYYDYDDTIVRLFFDGQYLWASGFAYLHKINISDGADLGMLREPSGGHGFVSAAPHSDQLWLIGGYLYVLYSEYSGDPIRMYKINRSSLAIENTWIINGVWENGGVDAAFDGTYWYIESAGTASTIGGYRVYNQGFNEVSADVIRLGFDEPTTFNTTGTL